MDFMHYMYPLLSGIVAIHWLHAGVLGEQHGKVHTKCGGVYEESKGVLFTPNFPDPYPTPIYCEWLIHAPPGKKILLYFTQNYMKDSIYISSYDYYQDISTYVGRDDLGQIFWEHDLPSLVGYKPYVLLQFSVQSIGNRHLRVIDHLLDVYGFNITYEIVDTRANLSKETCSVKKCSYLGNCIVSADFLEYSCHCFNKFFGDNCQYGPYCDPDNGINLCSNGGLCKYFFGSLINQCECPDSFEGAYCERSAGEVLNPPVQSEECEALKCSHHCDVDITGQTHCSCPDGYSMSDDNGTCIPIDRYRFDVAMELQRLIKIPTTNEMKDIQTKIQDTLRDNGITSVINFEIHGLRNTSVNTVVEFHFYCLVSEVNGIQSALASVVGLGEIGGYTLKDIVPKYEKNPELILSEVMNYDPHPTLRGKMLTLVCAAKGSDDIEFSWYKDSVLVNTSLTSRNAWQTIIPHSVHGMFLSVLNIDSVMPIDQGIFSCQATDFGQSVVGNVEVTVNNYPRVQLDPMSLSVNNGKAITFKCLSPDDSWQQFSYEWFKNGLQIALGSNQEYAEDMFPTGVRLVIPSVMENAEYTCKVTNEAGSANVSAYVFVIADNGNVQFCLREYVGEVMWSRTSGGHFDVKRCPTEQGGEYTHLGTIDFGYARRNCECDETARHCKWAEPNFSKCQSLQLIHTYDELELLRNGYQYTHLSNIFDDLHTFTLSKNEHAMLYSGDMDMVAGILKELIGHMKAFPQLVETDHKIEAKRLVDLIAAILLRTSMSTPDEKMEILVGPSVVQTVNTLITGAIKYLKFKSPLKLSTHSFEMKEEEYTEVHCATCDLSIATLDSNGNAESEYTLKLKTYTIRSKYLPNLLSYRDIANNKADRLQFSPISAVYSVAHINEDVTSYRNPTARIIIHHNTDITVARLNTTVCLKWDFETRNIYSGQWILDGCVTVESHHDRTVCQCRLPGHFISAMIPSNTTDMSDTRTVNASSLPLLIAYSCSLVFVLIALVIYIMTFSQLQIEIHTVHLSFILSITCANLVQLVCLIHVDAGQTVVDAGRGIVALMLYVASTALVLEMFQMFLIAYNIKKIVMTNHKFLIVCWGIPFMLMVPMVIAAKDADDTKSCHTICWLYVNTKLFIVFVVTMALNVIAYIVLLTLSICSLRKWTEEWRYADRLIYMRFIAKNSILYLLLLLSMGSGIDLEAWSEASHIAPNVTFQLSLCISVLIIRCIVNEQIRSLCLRIWCRAEKAEDQNESKSFRAFLEPKKVSSVVINLAEDNVSKYYEEVNRTKYTKERKRLLSSLLGSGSPGSGSGSGSGGSTVETTVSYNSERNVPSFTTELFQNSGTDCGILKGSISKSASSVGASGSVKDEIQTTTECNIPLNMNIEKHGKNTREHTECSNSNSGMLVRVNIEHVNQPPSVQLKTLNQRPITEAIRNPLARAENALTYKEQLSKQSSIENQMNLTGSSHSSHPFTDSRSENDIKEQCDKTIICTRYLREETDTDSEHSEEVENGIAENGIDESSGLLYHAPRSAIV